MRSFLGDHIIPALWNNQVKMMLMIWRWTGSDTKVIEVMGRNSTSRCILSRFFPWLQWHSSPSDSILLEDPRRNRDDKSLSSWRNCFTRPSDAGWPCMNKHHHKLTDGKLLSHWCWWIQLVNIYRNNGNIMRWKNCKKWLGISSRKCTRFHFYVLSGYLT